MIKCYQASVNPLLRFLWLIAGIFDVKQQQMLVELVWLKDLNGC